MKRIISLILALALFCALIPAAAADSGGAVSNNLDDHWYINAQRYSAPIRSTLAYEDGVYLRVEAIDGNLVVERYDDDFNYLSGKTIPLELPIYGGVRMDSDYNFVVVGQNNPEEDDSKEVFRIIRYTKDWQKVDHASICGANTFIPFDAGSCRFDRSGDILYIRTAHEMYTSDDGLNHQANVMIAVRISDMTVTDYFADVLNNAYGYVSHSFNQFVRVDGDTLLAVDHGDAHPRSVALFKYSKKAGEETFFGRTSMVNALSIVKSAYHYNDTGVSVGGFEYSSTDYLIAGNAYDMSESIDLKSAHRNIFVTATPKDDFTDEATTVNWLTHYAASDNVSISPPHFIKLESDRFMLIWTENGNLKYCFVDGHGQLIGEICNGGGVLSDCVPIVVDDSVLWYVTNQSAPIFLQIGLTLPHEHHYCTLVTQPTCSEDGYSTYVCPGCGDSQVEPIPTTGHAWTEWYLDYEGSCTTSRQYRRNCTRCSTAQISSSPVPGHSWGDWYTAKEPTCTDPGFEQRDCSRCSDNETRELPALGHSWQGSVCTRCGEGSHPHFDDVIPGSYYEAPVAWAVQQGITSGVDATHFGPDQSCTRAQVVTFLWAAAGRPDPQSSANPFVDVETGIWYEKPVLWAVEKGITSGVDADHFGPNQPCTRSQVVTFLYSAAGKPEASGENPFTDVPAGSWFEKPVIWAKANGITSGLSATEFGANAICTRAQVVTFLYAAFGK